MHSSIAKHVITNNSNENRYFVWVFANFVDKYKHLVVDSYLKKYND